MDAFTLGLMTTDLPKPRRSRPVSDATWRLLAKAGREAGGTVVFFHPHEIDVALRRVQGCAHHPDRGWEFGTWPLPAVIVDNVYVKIARKDRTYAAVKRTLQQLGITFLNPRLPDKWGVWKALLARPELRPHLPETMLLKQGTDVEEWLERHPSAFLKPVRGSGGHGVLQVRANGEGAYLLTDTKTRTLSPEDLHVLAADLVRREKHLLQRGLPLLEIDRCRIDIRVVLYRDGEGGWQAVAVVPRAGLPGQAVTNLAQGGEKRTLEWLREFAAIPSEERIVHAAVLAAEAVTKIRPTLAFLGIDVALDRDGGLWVIDVNPRPGRKVLTMEDRKTAYAHLVAWAQQLMRG